ncbi:MAG: hypothetical protein M4D80_04960 [Myxococcota bacterium]|nr:hypothetical protein [Myxococcota bacterium]
MSRALVVASLLVAQTARADDAPPPDEVSTKRRLAAVGAALVPGVLIHGSGSWVLHEKRAAKRLAITGGIGFGAMALAGAAVGITGAAESMVIWAVPMMIAGTGLWLPTWFSDIWYAAGGPRVRGAPHAPTAWSLDLATTWLHDSYRERALIRGAGRVEFGRIGGGASALVDAEGRARTGDLEARVRILGAPADGTILEDGSRLYVRTAVRRHVDEDDKVEITTGEIEAGGRLDMQHIDRNLNGTFLEVAIGVGLEKVTYADLVSDDDFLFLGRFAWGLYLGTRSELTVFYDHRRDSLAGGIAAGRAAGFVGSVGTNVDLRLGGPFAFIAELEIGNGWVTTAGIRYHGGPL